MCVISAYVHQTCKSSVQTFTATCKLAGNTLEQCIVNAGPMALHHCPQPIVASVNYESVAHVCRMLICALSAARCRDANQDLDKDIHNELQSGLQCFAQKQSSKKLLLHQVPGVSHVRQYT